jgi:putative oxidoreductase
MADMTEEARGPAAASAALLGRLLMSAIFIWSGYGKLMGSAATIAYFGKIGLPQPGLALALAVAVELGGGILLLVGLFTRPVAIVLALWCVATALIGHSDFGDRNMQIHFMKNVAMTGGFLYVALLGAGALSLDAMLFSRAKLAAA